MDPRLCEIDYAAIFKIPLLFRFGHTMIPPGIYRRRLSSKTEGKCEFVPARNGGETHYHTQRYRLRHLIIVIYRDIGLDTNTG